MANFTDSVALNLKNYFETVEDIINISLTKSLQMYFQ